MPKKERKHTAQGRDGRTARRHHTAHRDFKERSVVLAVGVAHPPVPNERKKTDNPREDGTPPHHTGIFTRQKEWAVPR